MNKANVIMCVIYTVQKYKYLEDFSEQLKCGLTPGPEPVSRTPAG